MLNIVALLINFEVAFFQGFVAVFLVTDLFASALYWSFIITFVNILQIFLRIPLADLSQLFGRKRLMIFGGICFIISQLTLWLSTNLLLPVLSGAFFALGMSSFWISLFAFVADLDKENFGNRSGKIFRLADFGVLISSLSAKFFLDTVHMELRTLFLLAGLVGVAAVMLLIMSIPATTPIVIVQDYKQTLKQILRSFVSLVQNLVKISRLMGMKTVLSMQIIIAYVEYLFSMLYPVIIINKGFSDGTIGEISFWGIFLAIWFYPWLGKQSDIHDYRSIIIIALVLCSICLFLAIITSDLLLLVVFFLLITCSLVGSFTALSKVVATGVDESQRGVALGVLGVYISIGRTLSASITGIIWEQTTLEFAYNLTAVILFILALALTVFARTKQLAAKHVNL
jgi:MFS family permease